MHHNTVRTKEHSIKRLPIYESKQLIEWIGGNKKVSEICGVSTIAVNAWKVYGIPRGYALFLLERFWFLEDRYSNENILNFLSGDK